MEDLGIPELTSEQIEELCTVAETAARKCIHSRVPAKNIETLNISAEAQGTKPVNLIVDVDLDLSPLMKEFEAQKLAEEAVKEAFKSAEEYLRGLTCRSQK